MHLKHLYVNSGPVYGCETTVRRPSMMDFDGAILNARSSNTPVRRRSNVPVRPSREPFNIYINISLENKFKKKTFLVEKIIVSTTTDYFHILSSYKY